MLPPGGVLSVHRPAGHGRRCPVPRLRRRRDAVCAAHGSRCRLGGGSSYASPLCHEHWPPCVAHGWECEVGGGRGRAEFRCTPETEPSDQEQALRASVREATAIRRAEMEGITPEEAL